MSRPPTSESSADPRHGSRYRWLVLAAGTFAQAGYSAIGFGVAVLAPAIRAHYGLSLAEVGLLLAAPALGSIATLYPWGLAADRFGERAVLASGLGAAAGCLAAAAFVSSFGALIALLFLAGGIGASVSASTGRAVMYWFDAQTRGFALGVRQTAVPLAGFWCTLVLPAIVEGNDPQPAFLALAGLCATGPVAGLLTLREHPGAPRREAVPPGPAPWRDRTMWLLTGGAALVIEPQVCLVGFMVVFLHSERGLSTAAAAAVLAVVNLLGIGSRIAAGRWSDLVHSRLRPLRAIVLGCAVLVICCTVVLNAPLAVLLPLLVLMGCAAISWNGLAFAAVAEAAGIARSGAALGMQQAWLAFMSAVLPIAFGAFVAGTSWRAGFAVSAFFPLAGWRLFRSVPVATIPRA